jgi:hypothetical protein
LLGEGDFTKRIYTSNVIQSCTGGCVDDCEAQPDKLCYTEYPCSVLERMVAFESCESAPEPLGYICMPLESRVCLIPAADMRYGTENYVTEKACE